MASKNNLDKWSTVPYKKRWILKVYNMIFQLDKGIRYCWLTTHIHLPFIPTKTLICSANHSFPHMLRVSWPLSQFYGYFHSICVQLLSCVQLFVTLWIVAYQIPLAVEFTQQEYWSGLPFPPLWDLSNPGIRATFPALQADSLLPSHHGNCVSSLVMSDSLRSHGRSPQAPLSMGFSRQEYWSG